MKKVRTLVFHAHHEKAHSNCYTTRLRLRQMSLDIVKNQVDYMGGDANASVYKYYKNDSEHTGQLSIKHSSLMRTIQTMVEAVNKVCFPLQGGLPLIYQAVTATTTENLDKIKDYFDLPPARRRDIPYPDQDAICMVAFSWGHSCKAAESRVKAQEYIEKSKNPIAAGEYLIVVNEQAMKLQNRSLWLTSYNTDWHRPLQVTMRTFFQKNKKHHSLMSTNQHWYRNAALQREGRAPSRSSAENTYGSWSPPPWRTKEQDTWKDYSTNAWNERGSGSWQTWQEPRPPWTNRSTQEWTGNGSSSSSTARTPQEEDLHSWRPSLGRGE